MKRKLTLILTGDDKVDFGRAIVSMASAVEGLGAAVHQGLVKDLTIFNHTHKYSKDDPEAPEGMDMEGEFEVSLHYEEIEHETSKISS